MTRRHYSNLAPTATISGSLSNAATTISVTPGLSGFPSSFPYTVAIDRDTASEELVLVTSAAGSTATMTRGYGGTTATSHTVGATFEHVVDATDADEANAHVNATSAVHGVTGSLVGTSDAQTVTAKTFSSNVNLATSTDPGLKTQAAGSGTAAQIQALDSAGTTTLFQVARDGATTVTTNTAANTVLKVKGATSQSGPHVDVQNSSAASLFQVDSAGRLVHKPSSLTSSQAYKLVPPDSTTRNAIVLRTFDDSSDQFVLDSSGAITTMSTAYLRGFFSNDVLRYPVDGSTFKLDSSGNIVTTGTYKASNGGGKVALTRATTGSQSTTSGAEVLWSSLQTAASMTSGRKYRIMVTCQVDSVTVSTPLTVRVRNSKSASAPTTSSTEIANFQTTPQTFAEDKTWVFTYTADTTGTNTLGVSVARLSGSGEVSIGACAIAAEVLIEDIGT